MAIDASSFGLEWLKSAVKNGEIHTVRFSFGDHLGAWRGKRIPAEQFLGAFDQPLGFCNAMLVCDVQCDISEATPFSNYSTGYPDMHIWSDISSVRPAAWAPGEAFMFGEVCDAHHQRLGVAPRNVLSRVIQKLASLQITSLVSLSVAGRLMKSKEESIQVSPGTEGFRLLTKAAEGVTASGHPVVQISAGRDPGSFKILLEAQEPMAAAESALVLKGALKELARQSDMYAIFMSRSPGSTVPSMQEISLSVNGLIESPDLGRIRGFLNEGRSILQPSINAFKVGPLASLRLTEISHSVQIHDFKASSEADPFTSVAVILAALDFEINSVPAKNARNLAEATDQLAISQWAQEWLGREYIENTLPLVRNEITLFEESITDWETARYWSAS